MPVLPYDVTDLLSTFARCTSLTDISNFKMPDSVISLDSTFYDCTNIGNLYISKSATNLWHTFNSCTALVDVSNFIIPSHVTELYGTFANCTSLTGNIEINSIQTSHYYSGCFSGVDFAAQNLTITGTSNYLNKIIQTGTNY